jgi:predicted small secreted protein
LALQAAPVKRAPKWSAWNRSSRHRRSVIEDRNNETWSDEMMRPAFCLMISGLLLVLSACNTVQGVGRDIESVGTAGKDAIR